MKKSKEIQLILITAALASCNRPAQNEWTSGEKRVYMRSDSTAGYARTHTGSGYHGGGLWYYAFRPYGNYDNGRYQRAGYYSGAIGEHANVGSNGFKGAVSRGGFGRSGFSVSS
ncbi:hypothetical protein ACTHGU_03290 [Chitinophagaceae bacterium MMS25-I14]